MENDREQTLPQQPETNPQPTPVPMKPKGNKMSIIKTLTIFLLIGIIAYLVYQNYQLKQQLYKQQSEQATTTATPSPISSKDVNTKTFNGTVLPISFQYSSALRIYEVDKEGQGFGKGIHVVYDYPDNPPRYLHIDNTSPSYFDELKKLSVGQTYQDISVTDQEVVATRLPDIAVNNLTTLAFEWNERPENGGPIREYFVPFGTKYQYLHIIMTYSNVTGTNDSNPMYTFDYVTAFDQILDTLTFTGN